MRTAVIFVLFFLTGASPAAAGALDASANSGKHSRVTCDMVRAYVAKVGVKKAKAAAKANGITAVQAQKARRCLANSI